MIVTGSIVTKIEEMDKSRSKVFLDGEFAFVLYKGELRHYKLHVDGELSQADYNTIMTEILPKRAKLRAMNLLLKKNYTTAQLMDKLRQGWYPEEIIEQAIDYVASFHYIDDLRYASDYITYHQESKSRMRLEQDLLRKGIRREVLEAAWQQWEEDGGEQDEGAMIEALLQKRHYNAQEATPSERQKQYGFLMRKGFSADAVKKAVFGRFADDFE